jgi:DNA-directed RNA polymerase specialized sigma24 family protein
MLGPARQEVQELMARLGDGDRAAFAPLYALLWPALRAFCRRGLGHDADGDDAAQQALVNVFSRADEFDAGRDALTWAFGIAAWECRSARRRAGRRGERGLAGATETLADPGVPVDDELIRRELLRSATELLGRLRADDVATIVAALEGDPDGRAGIAPATFRKRLERALGRWRAAWRSKHGTL